MNDDDLLEEELRQLMPSPMPEDLRERLAVEPTLLEAPRSRRIVPWAIVGLAAAACLVALITTLITRPKPDADEVASEAAPQLSVLQQESTLLNTRPLALKVHDGQVWEIAEEEWRDDTVALCSATPVRVRSTENRREIVCLPVEFQ